MNYLSSKFNFERSENSLSELLSKIRQQKDFIDLTTSNPTKFFSYDLNKIKLALTEKSIFPYEPDPRGMKSARNALTNYYKLKGREMNKDHFFLTSGTSEAMSFILKTICNPGSEVLLPTPGYPLYDFILNLENATAQNYSFIPQKTSNKNKLSWEIDFSTLERKINKNTKAIVIVEPNNPTGSRVNTNDALRLADIAKENNLVLIIDEVFSDYYPDYYKTNLFAKVNHILLNGLSKMIAMPQLKLSWIYLSGDFNFLKQMQEGLEIVADTYLSVNIPVQQGLDILLETAIPIQQKIIDRIQANCLNTMHLLKNREDIDFFIPDGGWYLIININNFYDDEEFACKLLAKKSTYVFPGYMFDLEKGCYIVISLITPEEIFIEGIKRLINFLTENK